MDKTEPSINNNFHSSHVGLLIRSYRSITGNDFFNTDVDIDNISKEVFFAPFVVMSHGAEPDPIFNYANKCALDLFEMSWQKLIQLPSRFSADKDTQEERDRFLEKVSKDGYVNNYTGVRISSQGKRIQIRDAVVWNVVDKDQYYGQAVLINHWSYL